MNEENKDIVNELLLIGDKFMPEMHLWDPKAKKCSACGPFTRDKQRINDFMKDGKLSHNLKNKLDAAFFQHDFAYAKYKDRLNRKKPDIVLKNKALKIAIDPKTNGYQRGSGREFDKDSWKIKKLAEELHKPIIKNFKRRNVYSNFKDNIWGVDLADISLISKFIKGIK